MTASAEGVAQQIADRLTRGGYHDVTFEAVGDDVTFEVHCAIDMAQVSIYIERDHETGFARTALCFLFLPGDIQGKHMNYWAAPSLTETSERETVDAIWDQFRTHEAENEKAGRRLWMRPQPLPHLPAAPPVPMVRTGTGDIFDLFG